MNALLLKKVLLSVKKQKDSEDVKNAFIAAVLSDRERTRKECNRAFEEQFISIHESILALEAVFNYLNSVLSARESVEQNAEMRLFDWETRHNLRGRKKKQKPAEEAESAAAEEEEEDENPVVRNIVRAAKFIKRMQTAVHDKVVEIKSELTNEWEIFNAVMVAELEQKAAQRQLEASLKNEVGQDVKQSLKQSMGSEPVHFDSGHSESVQSGSVHSESVSRPRKERLFEERLRLFAEKNTAEKIESILVKLLDAKAAFEELQHKVILLMEEKKSILSLDDVSLAKESFIDSYRSIEAEWKTPLVPEIIGCGHIGDYSLRKEIDKVYDEIHAVLFDFWKCSFDRELRRRISAFGRTRKTLFVFRKVDHALDAHKRFIQRKAKDYLDKAGLIVNSD